MKRKVALLLLGCIILSCFCVPVSASTEIDTGMYRWSNIMSVETRLTFDGRSANYSAIITGANDVNNITASAVLYFKNSDGDWVEIPMNWTYDEDVSELVISEDFRGVIGREYKVELSAMVYMNGYGEPLKKTSTKVCQ
ncbi:MAG: hypothetical protein J6I50_10460 [Clostridia bacterium]|nr:hypothetical protein [Clostridia bacterium]